jgi:glycosyltransferase involved in cell wall biosynthesis
MKPNIVIQAPAFSVSGYGAHARDIILGLYNSEKYNISILPTQWGSTSVSDKFSVGGSEILSTLVNNKISANAEFTFVHIGLPTEVKKHGKTTICITAGVESDRLPSGWVEACNQNIDALIVPSTFMKDLFVRAAVKIPIYVVGEGTDTTLFNNISGQSLDLPIDTEFNFLTSGQWMQHAQMNDRKGISWLLKYFCEMFKDDPKVGLVIKTMSTNVSSPDCWVTERRIDGFKQGRKYPKIYLVHGDMTDYEMSCLYKDSRIKAFVSCTSGEGFGRTILEAVVSDLPVLVTGWSGHMDFIQKDLATVFDYDIAPIPPENYLRGLFEPGMQWAIPKEDDVKRKIRRCVDSYSIAKERALKLGAICRETFSKTKTDKDLVEAFDTIIKPVSNIIVPGIDMERM